MLTVVKLLDEQALQLYAEPNTTGQDILDQACTMLQVFEKYYFGLEYYDAKVRCAHLGGPHVPLYFHACLHLDPYTPLFTNTHTHTHLRARDCIAFARAGRESVGGA